MTGTGPRTPLTPRPPTPAALPAPPAPPSLSSPSLQPLRCSQRRRGAAVLHRVEAALSRDVRATLLCVMAILKVARLGHPVLRQKAQPVPVDDIRSAGIQRLIDDMVETMREYDGAGLAANQVHTLLQIAVIEVDGK